MQQRLDIQCLRAFAVIAVVIYHAYPQLLPGGFIGVDVFFVISGFLMTRIITGRLRENAFKLTSFYGSRTRRIMPALIVCLIVFYLIGFYSGLYIEDIKELKRTARSALLGFSNVYFYLNTGYFDMAAASQIFLHTWSLGVELQFYFVYPLLMLGCIRFLKMSPLQVVVALLLLSFGVSCYLVYANQTAAFYLLPSRVWEFLLGGLLAITQWSPQKQWAKSCLLWGGFLVIAGCSFLPRSLLLANFPGLMALPPCLGAVLFLAGGQLNAGAVGRAQGGGFNGLLVNRFFSFTGNLSYSLYLWHWPVLVLYRFFNFESTISPTGFLVCLLVIVACSYLSWRFVEEPVRRRFPGIAWQKQLVWLCLAMGVLPLLYTNLKNPGFFYPQAQQQLLSGARDKSNILNIDILGDREQPVSFLVIGDSHARALGQAISELAQEKGKAGRFVRNSMVLLNVKRYDMRERNKYDESLLQEYAYDTAYIIIRWGIVMNGYLPHELTPTYVFHERSIHYSKDGRESWGAEAVRDGLVDTVEFLHARGVQRIYVLLPIPENHYVIPKTAVNLSFDHTEAEINGLLGVSFEEYAERNAVILDLLAKLQAQYDYVSLLDPRPLLAGERGYNVIKDGRSLYHDDDHLSNYGAWQLMPLFTLEP